MVKELLFEIGTEEIPAGLTPVALDAMKKIMGDLCAQHRIDIGEIITDGTPRRLMAAVRGVSESQKPQRTEKIGPPVSVSFDADGTPNQKALGFAKGQGMSVDELSRVKTDKGEYLAAVKEDPGRPTVEILPDILSVLINDIPFKKSMRWMDLDVRFVRPVHWIVALFDGKVVPVSFGNIKSGDRTRGHRFMHNEEITVSGYDDYVKKLRDARVIVSRDERRGIIEKEIGDVARSFGGEVLEDRELIDEIVDLVEFPDAVGGTFDTAYLTLPRDIPVIAMRKHQRYFSVVDKKNDLMPHFITVSNTVAKDQKLVAKGNERVLAARLEDARFYYEDDMTVSLESRVEDLKNVVFHSKLGTSYEKVMRFKALAVWLSETLFPEHTRDVAQAALLAKADLDTGVVQEFPDLQGIIGREYALKEGIKKEVAQAISEHYLPVSATGRLPEGVEGTLVSLADKMDTITGFFGVGMPPTGTADPYALRRNTIAIVNILLVKEIRLSLNAFIDRSLELLDGVISKSTDETKADVTAFFTGRFSGILTAEGYPQDAVDAVLEAGFDDVVGARNLVKTLTRWKERAEFSDVAAAIKRVGNILKDHTAGDVDESLLSEKEERELFDAYSKKKSEIQKMIEKEDYEAALTELVGFRKPIDAFFEGVMVMAKDEKVKNNRLALLSAVRDLFVGLCDFSRIEAAGER
ncbi:MAG: glycine--tRNA ligase subunit beta [Deltaproteobacteria bacterium]|nr:glycine--tRNA ligase subunit beta [Candidatus Zymogenaceae bacterium]